MANRTFNDAQALEKEVKTLYAKFTVGASGAPTLVNLGSLGAASISRTSAGLYVLTLSDAYPVLLQMKGLVQSTTAEDITFQLKSEAVSTAKTITFFTLTGGVATDPASGDTIRLEIAVKNTSVNY